ncbi:amidohydrolase family protein [Nocardioides carbamazepini]|uniref:amidohydrolase family protein n=1 Tax=Nocardioides carbamazepini TaxID=2854259 RepID=UPI00214A06F4|nr:amidohydrolase family protein [Nocardioides carbamazepini]MCR1784528.1 amidohydrolase family protein [Nocardioides carbamazepini]
MRVVDSHMHLIDITAHDWYPGLKIWSEGLQKPDLYRDFSLETYRAAAGDLRVDTFVHVSATTKPGAHLAEAAWLDELAEAHDLDLAVVGTVDPAGGAAEIRAELDAQGASPRFRGVRVLYGFDPGTPAADTVLGWLDERGLVFDLVINPEAMTPWLRTLERFPDLPVVLEHTGWPSAVDTDGRADWQEALRQFATATSAPCKLSGLGMATMDVSEANLRPWLEFAIDQLGWERVMFGSNMPIETMGGSFGQLITTLRAVVGEASPAEQARFWGENAAAAYRL